MSPELLDPERFGLKDSRQTKRSDCYALGMVVYEVLSGQLPFSRHHTYAVIARVLEGERPGRPRGGKGARFTNDIWSILERCWKPTPGDRPGIKDVLLCLEAASRSWTPSSPQEVAGPPATSSLTWNSELNVEESTDDGEESPPSSEGSGGIPGRVSWMDALDGFPY